MPSGFLFHYDYLNVDDEIYMELHIEYYPTFFFFFSIIASMTFFVLGQYRSVLLLS